MCTVNFEMFTYECDADCGDIYADKTEHKLLHRRYLIIKLRKRLKWLYVIALCLLTCIVIHMQCG